MNTLYSIRKCCTLLLGLCAGVAVSAQTAVEQDGIRFYLHDDGTAEAGEVVSIVNYEYISPDAGPWTPVDGQFSIAVPPYVYDAAGERYTVTAIGNRFSWTDTLATASLLALPSTLQQADFSFLASHAVANIVCGAVTPPAIVNPHRPRPVQLYVPSEAVAAYKESDWGERTTLGVSLVNAMYRINVTVNADGTRSINSFSPANSALSIFSDIVLPDQIDGAAVSQTTTDIPALSVTVPEGVSGITATSRYCTTEIHLPSTLKSIPSHCFYSYLSNGDSRRLERVFLAEGLESIGEGAFSHCGRLKRLHIPASVSHIGDGQSSLHALEAFEVDEGNTHFASLDGVLYTRDLTTLKQYPSGKPEASYTVPKGVKTLSAWSLEDAQNLRELRLPTTLDSIGECALNVDTLLTAIHFSTPEPPATSELFWSWKADALDTFYANCTLYVPTDATAAYRQHAIYAHFTRIAEEAIEPEAVDIVSAAAPVPVADYDLSGRRVRPDKGLVIRRMSDGTTRKLLLTK